MIDLFIKPLFKFCEEDFPAIILEPIGSKLDNEVVYGEHTIVQYRQDRRIDNDRPEFFHEIERQSWTTVEGTVQVADKVVEAHQLHYTGNLVGEQRIAKA